jgi:hypothetical protein
LLLIEEHDGIVAAYTVSAPPQDAGMMGSPPMPVHIATVEPKQKQSLMAAVHASLVQRFDDINKELRDLGVTGGPPDRAQGGGLQAELHPARQ